MTRWSTVLAILCCLLGRPRGALAAPFLSELAARKVLRVGIAPGLTPFEAVGEQAAALRQLLAADGRRDPDVTALDGRTVRGFDVDLVREVARALGAKLEIVLVDRFEDLLPGLRAGRYDLVASAVSTTLERATSVSFSDPYFASGLVILVRDGKRFPLLESLRHPEVRIGFIPGTTAATFIERELAMAHRVPLDASVLLHAIDDARLCDAVVTDYVSARALLVAGRRKTPLVVVEDRRFSSESFAFVVRQGDPDWVAWLNLFLRQEKASGAFHRLAARYNAWFKTER